MNPGLEAPSPIPTHPTTLLGAPFAIAHHPPGSGSLHSRGSPIDDSGDSVGFQPLPVDTARFGSPVAHMSASAGSLPETAPVPLAPATVGERGRSASVPSDRGSYLPLHTGEEGGGAGDAATREVIWAFYQRTRETPPLRLLFVLALVLGLVTGNAMIVICLNFWLDQFPSAPGRYTVLAVSGMAFSAFFLAALGLYLLVRRPNLAYLRHAFGWRLLVGIAAMDTLNSAMAIYAAPRTAEVLQALFTALVPVYAAVFTKLILRDPRQYCHRHVLVSFALIIAGVALASLFYLGADEVPDEGGARALAFLRLLRLAPSTTVSGSTATRARASPTGPGSSRSTSSSSLSSPASSLVSDSASASAALVDGGGRYDTLCWSLIFFLSVIPTVLMNVGQTLYMMRYTYDENFPAEVAQVLALEANVHGGAEEAGESGESGSQPAAGDPPAGDGMTMDLSPVMPALGQHPHHASDTTVKLVMLATGTTLQSVFTLLLMPMDALPWYGSSASIPETWNNFKAGIDCLLHCPNNLTFCCLYCAGFVLVYISAAYLNQYSVTLCSMVSQLSAPITALVLVLVPRLNPGDDVAPWYASVTSACVLGAGTFLYVLWDERTAAEKHLGEVRLKMDLLGLLPGRREDHGGDGHTVQDAESNTVGADAPGRLAEGAPVENPDEGC